jgi:hypothetical protein
VRCRPLRAVWAVSAKLCPIPAYFPLTESVTGGNRGQADLDMVAQHRLSRLAGALAWCMHADVSALFPTRHYNGNMRRAHDNKHDNKHDITCSRPLFDELAEHSRICRPSEYICARKTWRGSKTDRRFNLPQRKYEGIGDKAQDSRSRFLRKVSRILPQNQKNIQHRGLAGRHLIQGRADRIPRLQTDRRRLCKVC